MSMKIGRTITLFRVAAGVSQKKLANALGVSASYLSMMESDKREPSLTHLRALSDALSVPIAALAYEIGSEIDQYDEREAFEVSILRLTGVRL